LVERLDQTQTALDIPVDLKSLQMDAGFKARRAGKRRRHVSNNGFLGKLLCERVRERDGIGFDVGAVVDVWAGHTTRQYEATSLHFDLASSLIADQPFIDDFCRRASRGTGRCFSDDTRRRDIAAHLPAERLQSNVGAPRKLRIVGHPRCGSGYVSRVFIALGCNVGRECHV
jgi:hypothetical protein